jgi:hypothetical protein
LFKTGFIQVFFRVRARQVVLRRMPLSVNSIVQFWALRR